jgi:uncharacterized protein YeaO (DUF488 family)
MTRRRRKTAFGSWWSGSGRVESRKPICALMTVKDVAPSAALRRWFSHDPKKWAEFRKRYFAELDSHPEACAPIRSAARHGRVTLVYSSQDAEHNNAAALKEYLIARKGKKRKVNHA